MRLDTLSLQSATEQHEKGELHGFFKMPDKEYHACSFAINQSRLKTFMVSPAHFLAAEGGASEDTPAMAEGRAWHCQLFEPEQFGSQFLASPKFDRRTKQGKADSEAWAATHSDATILDPDVIASVQEGAEAILSRPTVAAFVRGGLSEVAAFARDAVTGILLRVKLDKWFPEAKAIIDLKTTAGTLGRADFSRTCVKYGYFFQAAFYCDVVEAITGERVERYGILAVEKKPPYGARIFFVNERAMEYGRTQYRRCLDGLFYCRETNQWPCYETVIEDDFGPPEWAYRDEDNWALM